MAAGTTSLGRLTLDLVLKAGAFTAGMDSAARITQKRLDEMQRRAEQFASGVRATFAVAGLAATAAFTALALGVKSAIDSADAMRDLSIRLGVSTETLSAFGYAAQQTGTDIDSLGRGLKILAKNANDAMDSNSQQGKLFAALGINVKDATGNLKQLSVLVPEIAEKFKGLEDGTTKAALAQQLFGKTGLDLTEFLNQGADGLQTMTDKARDLGIVIDQQTANAADDFKDNLADLKAMSQGLFLKLAADLLPALKDLVADFKDLVNSGDKVQEMADGVVVSFNLIKGTAITLSSTVKGVTFDLIALFNALQAKSAFLHGDFAGAAEFAKQAVIARQLAAAESKDIERVFTGEREPRPVPTQGIPGPTTGPTRRRTFPAGTNSKELSDRLREAQDAEDLQKSYEAVNARLREQVALHGQNGEAAKLRYDLEQGKLQGLAPAQKAELMALAKQADAQKTGVKDARLLAKATNDMADAQRAWQTELDGTGNQVADDYARRLDTITSKSEDFIRNGLDKGKVAQFREEMTKLADALKAKETAEFMKEFDFQTEEMIASANGASTATIAYARAMDELDKVMKSGIITQDEYAKRAEALEEARDSASKSVLRDIQSEIDLLGKSAEAQEAYNRLKQAGAEANSSDGQKIIEANHALFEQGKAINEQIQMMDEFRTSGSNAFQEIVSGAKSAKDALSDFFDNLYNRALKLISDGLIEQLLGPLGTSGAGSGTQGGNFLGSVLGALGFGGGRAMGGPVMAGSFYEVGERNRPELFESMGKQYLVPGNQGRVTPMRGGNLSQTFIVQGAPDNRTRAQLAMESGRQASRAMARNGG